MNIVVLMKQTFDTEEKIMLEDGQISKASVKFVINPYDEYAVEAAVRLKEQHDGHVTIVSVGKQEVTQSLRTALAMGADEAVLIDDDRIGEDEYSVSRAIAAYLSTVPHDVVLGGNFSVDLGAGQVAIRVARLLRIPHISAVTSLTADAGHATAVRDMDGRTQTIDVQLPALFTAQQGLNEPRYPSLPGIMKAKKKPLTTLNLDALHLSSADVEPRTARVKVQLPPPRKAGQRIEGPVDHQVQQLAEILLSATNSSNA